MIYVGDALFPGGNYYPAEEGGVVSIAVRDPDEYQGVIENDDRVPGRRWMRKLCGWLLKQSNNHPIQGGVDAVFLALADDDAVASIDFHGTSGKPVGKQGVDGIFRLRAVSVENLLADILIEPRALCTGNRGTLRHDVFGDLAESVTAQTPAGFKVSALIAPAELTHSFRQAAETKS